MYHSGGCRARPDRRGVDAVEAGGIGFFSGLSRGAAKPSLAPPSSALAAGVWRSSGGSSGRPVRVRESRAGSLARGLAGLHGGPGAPFCFAGSPRSRRCGLFSWSSKRRKRSFLRSACRPLSASVSSSLSPKSYSSSSEASRAIGAGCTSIGDSGHCSAAGGLRRPLGGGDLGGGLGGVLGGVPGGVIGGPERAVGLSRCWVACVACVACDWSVVIRRGLLGGGPVA